MPRDWAASFGVRMVLFFISYNTEHGNQDVEDCLDFLFVHLDADINEFVGVIPTLAIPLAHLGIE
jgi:hypothetical protein